MPVQGGVDLECESNHVDAMERILEYNQEWLAIHSLDDLSTPKAMHISVSAQNARQNVINQTRKRQARQAK